MTWKPVIVGVDASLQAAQAAELGWRIAAAAGVSCHLVHAIRDVRSQLLLAPTRDVVAGLELALKEAARREIERVHEGSVPPEALRPLETHVGRPVMALARAVQEHDAGLVVLGGKHHTALGRWWAGSTAHDAVRRLHVPLLVNAGPATDKHRVLVAVDLSPAAGPTIAVARQLAALFHAQLRTLHVVEPVPVISDVPPALSDRDLAALAREHLEREVWPLVPDAGDGHALRFGTPTAVIAQEAADWDADLVVVGSHGRDWLGRLVIGSVTEQLLGRLPTSLLVVPPPAAAAGAPALAGIAHAATHTLLA